MKQFLTIACVISILALGGCASQYKEKKAPCGNGKTASLSNNPCNPLPINITFNINKQGLTS